MNTKRSQEEKKETTIKTLAIIGLIAVVFIALWALVQAARYTPTAFQSLASIADTLYSQEEPLVIDTNKSVVNTGETLYVTWNNVGGDGTYTFTYECVDGVTAEVRKQGGDITSLSCDSPFEVTEAPFELEILFASEEGRFVDIPYSIAFTRSDENERAYERNKTVTIVNASIAQSDEVRDENGDEEEETNEETENEGEVAGTETTQPTGGTTRTVPVTTTSFPRSDPNGTVDLKITYLGIGSLNKDNDFTSRSEFDTDRRGAIRFEVKNIGTKTSDEWTVEAELPTKPRIDYESPEQDGLRPNERSVMTIGFDKLGDPRTDTIEATVDVDDDTNSQNDSFDRSVEIVD